MSAYGYVAGGARGYIESVRADQVRVGDVLSTDGYTVTWACLLDGCGAPSEISLVTLKAGHEKTAYLAPDTPVHLWRTDHAPIRNGQERDSHDGCDICGGRT